MVQNGQIQISLYWLQIANAFRYFKFSNKLSFYLGRFQGPTKHFQNLQGCLGKDLFVAFENKKQNTKNLSRKLKCIKVNLPKGFCVLKSSFSQQATFKIISSLQTWKSWKKGFGEDFSEFSVLFTALQLENNLVRIG